MAQQTKPQPQAPATNGAGTQAVQLYAHHGEELSLKPFADPAKYNLLSPVQIVKPLSPMHMVAIQAVRLSANPDHGDVYRDGSHLRPSKVGLMKLSAGAGIQWYPPECKMLYRDDNRVAFQAAGFLIGPDGVPRPIKATKELYLPTIEAEIRLQQEEKLEKGEIVKWEETSSGKSKPIFRDWPSEEAYQKAVDRAVRKEVLQKRRNMVALAETGAYLRAIRAALNIKSNWTKEEIEKPFVMVRTYVDPEADREMMREMMRESVRMSVSEPRVAIAPPSAGMLQAPTFDFANVPEAPDADDEATEVYDGDVPEDEESEVANARLPI